jgi:hypothetical protein
MVVVGVVVVVEVVVVVGVGVVVVVEVGVEVGVVVGVVVEVGVEVGVVVGVVVVVEVILTNGRKKMSEAKAYRCGYNAAIYEVIEYLESDDGRFKTSSQIKELLEIQIGALKVPSLPDKNLPEQVD